MKIVVTLKDSAIDEIKETAQRRWWSPMLVKALIEHVGKVAVTYSTYLPSDAHSQRFVTIYLANTRYKRYRDYAISVKRSWLDLSIPTKNIYEVSK